MKKRVLVVDDEADLVTLVKVRLESNGYEVLTAYDGEEGLEQAKHGNPDIILLDIMLPKLSGYEVCKRLKTDSRFQKIPILLFTARKSDSEEQLGLESGADGTIYKPYGPQELLDAIHSHLPKSPDPPIPPSN